MRQEEATEMLFKEFTDILSKHNVNPGDAAILTSAFGARWYFLLEEPLEPLKEILQKMSLSKYFEKQNDIKLICLRATEELRLLVS
ncbi:MAG: hypothetical protein P8013_09915 [Candidatus Sulfobium sp.]|jgi:hypothetical protein